MANDDTCGAYATDASDKQLCVFHSPRKPKEGSSTSSP